MAERFPELRVKQVDMLEKIYCAKCIGIDAVPVTVEVDIRGGVGIHLVGLADTTVKESLLRIVTALQALGYHIPGKKIVINLAPADLRKSGSGYDLPIALGIIAASEQRPLPQLGEYVIMGELGLNGEVREITGALAYAEMAVQEGFRGCILPMRSALEAVEYREIAVYGVRTLDDAVRILGGQEDCDELLVRHSAEFRESQDRPLPAADASVLDLSEIVGQESAKRGIEIAAAGGHNLILVGSPGSGKSSLAKAMGPILPPMTPEEAVRTSKIYSIAGSMPPGTGLLRQRPFRSPHYSATLASIVGGGSGDSTRPGEVTLAHNGILFLDEMAQMPRSVVEALRGPLEDRKVEISRLRTKVVYPCSFMLVAASNPCPCGYWGEGDRCRCTPTQRQAYMSRLSGPIMDRIDLQIFCRQVDSRRMNSRRPAEPSAQVAARVRAARRLQQDRLAGEPANTNAEMTNKMLEKYCPLSEECQATMESVINRLGLSMRSYFRVIKVARTIADLAGGRPIEPADLLEAAGYRFLDRRDLFDY